MASLGDEAKKHDYFAITEIRWTLFYHCYYPSFISSPPFDFGLNSISPFMFSPLFFFPPSASSLQWFLISEMMMSEKR